MPDNGYYNARPLISRGAIVNFVVSLRSKGKTCTFLRRAWRRFLRHGYGTYWVRRTEDERKKAQRKLIDPKRCKIMGAHMEDFKTKGDTIFAKRRGKWEPFLTFIAVSGYRDERSADDTRFREIVFDEYQTTPQAYRRYVGNEARDFFDLFFSKKRENPMRVFFLGNKESYANPYHAYFGVPEINDNMDGFYTFAGGSICLEVNNEPPPKITNAYERKFSRLLDATPYKAYLTEGATKNALTACISPLPRQRRAWANVDVGRPMTIYGTPDGYIFAPMSDEGRGVFVDSIHTAAKYRRTIMLMSCDRHRFDPLVRALRNNRVRFTEPAIAEHAQRFFQKIGVPF